MGISPLTAAPDPAGSERLLARYFDGRSSRERVVELACQNGVLLIQGPSARREVLLTEVLWPERTQRGRRVAHLPGGGILHALDDAEWDRWQQAHGPREGWVVRMQQSWRGVFVALALLVGLGVFMQLWGLPWTARAVVALMPRSVDASLEGAVLASLEKSAMRPSELPPEVQAQIRTAWEDVLRAHRAQAAEPVVTTRLVFRASRLGPNALALPGGTLLVTDDLVRLVGQDQQVLIGVLGHELGHVQQRHGLRMVVQVSLLGAVSSVVWGDFSTLLGAVPVLLGQAHYSREAEREADAHAVQVLRAAGLSPTVMVRLFERLARYERCGKTVLTEAPPAPGATQPDCHVGATAHATEAAQRALGLGFASHPAHSERVDFFRQAAGR